MQLDNDIAAALAASANAAVVVPERDDVLGLRKYINQMVKGLLTNLPSAPEVDAVAFEAAADDGTAVPLRWSTTGRHRPGSAIVYVHGGGRICGSVDVYEPLVRHYVQLTGVPFLAVDYRLAPEFRDAIATGDAFAATQWVFENADRLGVDMTRIAVMGDSGGGGVGAGAAILARDNGIRLARQILIYPMLDDRNT